MWLGSKFTSLSDTLFKSLFRFLFRYDIFISYARGVGREYALKLSDQLKQLDFSCFLDNDEAPAGTSLKNTLRRALKRSATLVIVSTERAAKSPFVEMEVSEFAKTGRAIIPIDIEGTLGGMPFKVIKERDLVWVDEAQAALARGIPSPNVADSIDKLVTASGDLVKLFEAGSWREVHALPQKNMVSGVAFSPDDKWLAVLVRGTYLTAHQLKPSEIYIWNTSDWTPASCRDVADKDVRSANDSQPPALWENAVCADVKGARREVPLSAVHKWKETPGLNPMSGASPDSRWLVVAEGKTVALWPLSVPG